MKPDYRETDKRSRRRRTVAAGLLALILTCGTGAGDTTATSNPLSRSSTRNTDEMNAEITRLRNQIVQNSRQNRSIRRELEAGAMTTYSAALEADGFFSDLDAGDHQTAFRRLHVLAAGLAAGPEATNRSDLKCRVYRGLLEYSHREAAAPTKFPHGAFEIPRAFLGSWFLLIDKIERDLQDPDLRPLLKELREVGGIVAAQTWVFPDHSPVPFRAENPVNVETFRGQGHFIVANFVPYRSVVEYAVFLEDESYLDIIEEVAKRSLHEPVNPSDPSAGFWREGIRPDRNITAHGPQTYIFGYGRDYLHGILNLAEFFDGGPYAFSQKEFDVVADVLLEAFVWFIYRDQMDYTVLGRHNLYPDSGHNGNDAAIRLLDRLLNIAADRVSRRGELLQARKRLADGEEFSGSKYFWNTEEYVHRSQDFSVVVNLSSTRTTGPEIVKPWAEHNFHFANGTMMLYRDGTEYREARGAWSYRALPGITAELRPEPPPYIHTWNGMRGTAPFAGGVSDGNSGACAFVSALEGEAARAAKAWFFHDNTIVCLGSGINASEAEGSIRTTLNQTAWRSPIHVSKDGDIVEFSLSEDVVHEPSSAAPTGIWHDGVSYMIESGNASLSASTQPTDWIALAEMNADKAASAEVSVFTLAIDHGQTPHDAAYAYAVRPGTTADEMHASLASPEWIVLANNPAVQAVEFPGADLTQAVFREVGSFETRDLRLQVDRPLILMLRKIADRTFALTYQDPLHQQQQTEVEVTLTFLKADKEAIRRTLTLPQGIHLGKPEQAVLKL